jgi:hypothetical protein
MANGGSAWDHSAMIRVLEVMANHEIRARPSAKVIRSQVDCRLSAESLLCEGLTGMKISLVDLYASASVSHMISFSDFKAGRAAVQ